MYFEILSEISDIETFASGSGIRGQGRLRRISGMDAAVGANERVSRAFACWMVLSTSPSYTGTKLPESGARNSKSNGCCEALAMAKSQAKQLVVCIANRGYAASLEKRKIYVVLRDSPAEKHGLLRIVDESGEDYLYPKTLFRAIALPQAVKKAVLAAA